MALWLPTSVVCLKTAWTRRVRRMTLSGMTSRGGSPLCAGRQGTLQRPNHFPLPQSSRACPGHVVHAVHQRPAPCKHRQADDITPSQTRRGGERSDEQELALEELFKRPLSRHAPTLRRLERDVVSPELGPVEIIAPRRDSSTPTTSSSHSSVIAVVSACMSN